MGCTDTGSARASMGQQVPNLRQQNEGWRKEMRMTTKPESEGQGAREVERASPSEPVSPQSPHLTRHKLWWTQLQSVRWEVLLLFLDAGNIDSGHVLQLSYHAESLGASSSPLPAEAFERLILVGWHL